uniref:Uncharacterized protein n=1 Tax=Salarias fasciatus TaxID=181472 RepID=A0A672HAB2_SALFA
MGVIIRPRYMELARTVKDEFPEADVSGFVGRSSEFDLEEQFPHLFHFVLVLPQIMKAVQDAHDGKTVQEITKSRAPCVIM